MAKMRITARPQRARFSQSCRRDEMRKPVIVARDGVDGPGGGDVRGNPLHILVVLQLLLRAA